MHCKSLVRAATILMIVQKVVTGTIVKCKNELLIKIRPCALLNKNNDNALSLLFKMGNE